MKRHRVLNVDFDTRARILSTEILESWQPEVQESWRENHRKIKDGLLCELGPFDGDRKIQDFTELGAAPWSVIGFHNKFMRQLRYAFAIGAYYPALTAACALGERVLNQLLLNLRDDFKATSEYKHIYRKDSFDNWDIPINTLESWDVLLPEATEGFRKLKDMRNAALHFNPETDTNDRELALAAIRTLTEVLEHQFAGGGERPWYFHGRGVTFVKKDCENLPFVKRLILPSCALVGPKHRLDMRNNQWIVLDTHDYEDKEITDTEFAKLYEEDVAGG